ncbi:DUF4369 domain-containing protein [Lacinutrix neustonica]|uniref:DUF4369 domain-containing protein n=1 Tax=Lacinutrix neustonica TaxID=2980107 RepID=A0A9E8MV93_9FLAO|nr:DUF4369 domain-containing protein [Lacinutrix neustonica]WAC02203.1 DUF4369 domain-containing protein [Lacinutrix neustonica]
MIKKIALISIILLAFACKKEKSAYELIATIDPSANNKKVEVLRRENGKRTLIDSTTIIDGKFSFTGSVESPDIYYIQIQDVNGTLPIILENSNIAIDVYIDSLAASSISGSKENDLIKTYLKSRKPFRDVNDRLMSRFRLNQSTTQDQSILKEINISYDSLKKAANIHDVNFIKDHPNSGFAAFTLERLTIGKIITKNEANELYHLLPRCH